MSKTLVQKLGALPHMTALLKSPNPSLQKTAMSLLGNLSSNSELHGPMSKKKLEVLISYVCFTGNSVK